ncbi:DUF2000 family protein [Streptomyces hygroscopicus]|uniref:DUF2000 family protein n=1 Tax=Streptomyces hygroscopicus TaxID=1912 RepID=UPI0036834E72
MSPRSTVRTTGGSGTAFLASGLAHATSEIVGKPYEDASGNTYLPLFREPALVHGADAPALARARTLSRTLPTALFAEDLFRTGNEDDNRAAIRAVEADALNLVGLGIYGPRSQLNKVAKGLKPHG